MKKRFVSLVLVLALLLAFLPTAVALSPAEAANRLHSLGLFQGVGQNADGTPNFALDRAPTRAEAITMFVRLIGASEAANAGTWQTPFTDVPNWALPYVGYAYTEGLTNGIGPTTFGSNQSATATQYLTFILRALGYISGEDFQWNRAWELTDSKSITDGRFNAGTTQFLRGDVAVVSFDALSATFKGSNQTLYAYLIAAGVFTVTQWAAAQSPQTPPPPAPSLVGTWNWMGQPYYVFEAGGGGTMTGSAIRWWTPRGGALDICITPEFCGNTCTLPMEWYYAFANNGNQLTLTSRTIAGMSFVYTRQGGQAPPSPTPTPPQPPATINIQPLLGANFNDIRGTLGTVRNSETMLGTTIYTFDDGLNVHVTNNVVTAVQILYVAGQTSMTRMHFDGLNGTSSRADVQNALGTPVMDTPAPGVGSSFMYMPAGRILTFTFNESGIVFGILYQRQ